MARAPSVSLPAAIAAEISLAAARAERSVGFLVHGALKSAATLSGAVPAGERSELAITIDEDDPKDLAARLQKLAGTKAKGTTLDVAVALAWAARRAQILAWVERVAAVNLGERADDLDDGLREASLASTSPERLLVLAQSAYPRVRALVVVHAGVPAVALELLRKDREKAVRLAFTERK